MAKRKQAARTPKELADAMHAVDLSRHKAQLADLNEKYKATIHRLREADDRLNAILGLKEKIGGHPPVPMQVRSAGKGGESTAFLLASDWHIEERVDPKTVNGVNEYTPEIATARVKRFFERGLSIIDMLRSRSRIDTLVLSVMGDLITNMLHEDQAESNYLSPTEATLKAYRLLTGGIDFLLEEGGFKKILVPCSFGNHGRTTKKMRVSTSAKNSYEWMMYTLIAERYAGDPRVQVQVADGYFIFLQVYGLTVRQHHGDDVRYQGGVGGVTIPLNKAIAAWNKTRRADLDILGHWHSRQQQRDWCINGSAIGYSPYSILIKASYEPPCQSCFLIHPKWGKTVEAPILLN
jgi:hypothetical protein